MSAALKERVLLVDDEPQVLVALEDLLSTKFVVLKTTSAEDALGVLMRERDIAVVITDQRMPKMNGDELLARLGALSDAQRIVLTGYADLSAVVRAVNEGRISAYVTKPWNADDLQLKVNAAAEHFRMAKDLAYERQLLHDLMDNIPDGIYFKDRDLRFRRANRSFATMVGVSDPQAIVGKRDSDVLSVEGAAERDAEERRVLSSAVPTLDVVREYRWNGVSHWLSETKAPIRGEDGGSVGLVGISRDVTRQRNLERQLAQAQKMEAIGRLAGGVSHDFNNLLAVIHSYIELAMRRVDSASDLHDDLAEVLAAAQRAAGLTRQLLAFSRRQVVQPRTVQLTEVVTDLEKMLRRIIGEDIDLVTRSSPGVGVVRADPGQIEQIIVNLTVNARDAMPAGGRLIIETANVTVSEGHPVFRPEAAARDFVVLTVSDNGTGMDAETRKRIFEPFFTTKDVGKGTGLGLSTVYGIVEQSGGHIVVESEVGQGTKFAIYFPRTDGAAQRTSRRPPAEAPIRGTGTILLVEDDEAVRKVAARILRECGYTVYETRRASDACRVFGEHGSEIDLLLTDMVMPETSGMKLASELCARNPGLRVLYMSGYPGAAVVHQGLVDAGTPYIEKPFSPAVLTEKVREVLSDLS